ncbi:MAG: hypothetical protein VCA18_05435 [Opitutales bacterium]
MSTHPLMTWDTFYAVLLPIAQTLAVHCCSGTCPDTYSSRT